MNMNEKVNHDINKLYNIEYVGKITYDDYSYTAMLISSIINMNFSNKEDAVEFFSANIGRIEKSNTERSDYRLIEYTQTNIDEL